MLSGGSTTLSVARAGTKRRKYTPTEKTVVQAAAKKQLTRFVKNCMKREAELKHLVFNDSFTPTNTGSMGTSCVLLAQGTGAGQRIGSQANFLRFNWICQTNLAAAAVGGVLRVICYIDHQPNGAVPGVTDILNSATYTSPYNMDKVGSRFRILKDVIRDYVPSSSTVGGTTGVVFKTIRGSHKINLNVQYQGTAGTVADVVKNSIGFLYISQSGNTPIDNRIQACFTDI